MEHEWRSAMKEYDRIGKVMEWWKKIGTSMALRIVAEYKLRLEYLVKRYPELLG